MENWFKENRDFLDTQDLPKGHAERFAEKLNASSPKEKSFGIWIMAAAAVLAVLLTISFFLGRETVSTDKDTVAEVSLSNVSSEMAEVEDHLASQVAMKMDDLRAYENTDEQVVQENIETLRKLEEEYELLKKDLAQNLNDERIINSMINNYRIRLKVMDRMLNSLESINNRTTQNEDLQI